MTMKIIPDAKFNFSIEGQTDTPPAGATEDLLGATEADKGKDDDAKTDKDDKPKDDGKKPSEDGKDKDKDKGDDGKGKDDDKKPADSDDEDDDDLDSDDDAAEEAIVEIATISAALAAQDAAVEAMGGLQPSMIMMTAAMAGIDIKGDPSMMAIESLGADAPEVSVQMAMESIETQTKGAIGRALDSMGTFVGGAINRVDDLIRKVPGGSAASDLEKKVEHAFSGVSAENAMKVIAAATVAVATVAAIGGVIVLRRAGAGATPKMAETVKRITETAIKRATLGFGGAGAGSVNTVGRAMGAATKAESGTVGALGWTKAAYSEVVAKLGRVLEDSRKAYEALSKGVKASIDAIKGGTEGVGMEAVKDMLHALAIVIRFVRAVAVGIIGVGLVRVIHTCRKLAEHGGESGAAA